MITEDSDEFLKDGPFGIIAGNGVYPFEMTAGARAAGERRVVAVAFENETDPRLAEQVDGIEWLRVGQLGRMLKAFREFGCKRAVMAGQIAPKNLFDLRPDMRALKLLATLPKRNAESLFGGIADELAGEGVELLPATQYMEAAIPESGYRCGPRLKERQLSDAHFGFGIAKEVSRLDIGQTVVVRNGTVLAVEAFEGTNEAMKRGAALGRKDPILVKVSKPDQDMRFDVPVIGRQTVEVARECRIRAIVLEAGRTLILERPAVEELASRAGITILALKLDKPEAGGQAAGHE